MDAWILLSDVVILLAASLLLGGVFSRLRQSPLVGYILAGMVLGGPGSLHLVRSQQAIEGIAELGVSLLLFSLGLEFSWSRLKKMGGRIPAGVVQVVLTAVVGAAVCLSAGLGWQEAVAVGSMISLSSTAVVLRVLMERSDADSAHGRNGIAVLLVQDIAFVLLAMIVAILGGEGSAGDAAANAGRIVLLAIGLVAGLYLVLNKIAVRALATLTLERNRELTILLAVVTGLGSAWAAHWAGVSPALGAFVAGMFLGGSPFATQIRADVSSLRVILLTLFFGTAGMVADPLWILQHLPLVLGVSLILIVGKTAIVSGIFQVLRQPAPIAVATGICLAQIGEFAFVLGNIGRSNDVLSDHTHVLITSVTIVTLIVSPLLISAAPWLGMRVASLLSHTPPYSLARRDRQAAGPDVVIIGFGPAGRIAAQVFVGRPERVEVLDLNHEGVRKAKELGLSGHVGDATQLEVLEHAHVDAAKLVVITIPHHGAAIRILEQIRSMAPHAHVVVRSRYQLHADDFTMAGAHLVVGDEEQVGESLGRYLRDWLEPQAQSHSPAGS